MENRFNKNVDAEITALKEKLEESGSASGVGLIAFGGSIAYGLDNENSDVDLRGFYLPSRRDLLLVRDSEQVERHDDLVDGVLYSARKMINLLAQNNPNTIEVLGLDKRHVLESSPAYELIMENTDAFISQKSAKVFGGYATQQLRKIKNSISRDEEMKMSTEAVKGSMDRALSHFVDRYDLYADGMISVGIADPNAGAQGVCLNATFQNLPITEVKGMCSELADIAKNADELSARNRKKEIGKLSKHMSHLIRLLRMGSEILETGRVNTYRENDRELLLAIKEGMWISENPDGSREIDDEFWDLFNKETERFEYARENTSLPEVANTEKVEEMIIEIHEDVMDQ